jgi:hypothetical protein
MSANRLISCLSPIRDVYLRQLFFAVIARASLALRSSGGRVLNVIDLEMSGPRGRATVRSSWIILHGEDFPRMTSCYVR